MVENVLLDYAVKNSGYNFINLAQKGSIDAVEASLSFIKAPLTESKLVIGSLQIKRDKGLLGRFFK